MIDPVLKSVVERLSRAGTVFAPVCVETATGRPLPPDSDLLALAAGAWDAVWVPTFVVLPNDHPDGEFVAEQMQLFYGDAAYAKRLEYVAAEMDMDTQEREGLINYDDADWDC